MATFVTQCVAADKLLSIIFAQKILLFVRFIPIFYLCTLAIGAVKGDFYYHINKKILTFAKKFLW